jgi:hypothetical protein
MLVDHTIFAVSLVNQEADFGTLVVAVVCFDWAASAFSVQLSLVQTIHN